MTNILLKASAFLIMIIAISCNTSKPIVQKTKHSPYKFNFEEDLLLTTVLDKADRQNKLVFLDISAEWCAPCQLMKRDVYSHQETADFFNSNFVNYLVDAEKGEGPDLKIIFGVDSYPTLLILDSKGKVVHRKEGGTFHEALIMFGKDGLAKLPN